MREPTPAGDAIRISAAILVLLPLLATPASALAAGAVAPAAADSVVCVRTTRWFPEIRRSVHCLPAAQYRRLVMEARANAAAERRRQEARDLDRRERELRAQRSLEDRAQVEQLSRHRLAERRAYEARWERRRAEDRRGRD